PLYAHGVPRDLHSSPTRRSSDLIDMGHKMATRAIRRGSPVKKFGQTIGFATCDIAPGCWVHTHNVEIGPLSLDYAYASDVPPDPDRKSTRLNSSHQIISYAVFCL